MKDVFSFFDAIFVINLDSRPDRFEECKREFSKVGILDRVIRIPGVIGNWFPGNQRRNASIGCNLSHAACVQKAKEMGVKNCLIFEDDVTFLDAIFDTLPYSIKELPEDYEIFYFGANLERPCYKISPHLARLTFALSLHAYCVNSKIFDEAYKICTDLNTIIADAWFNSIIVPRGNSYITVPMIAIQRPSFSNIENRVVNYSWMLERFRSNLKDG